MELAMRLLIRSLEQLLNNTHSLVETAGKTSLFIVFLFSILKIPKMTLRYQRGASTGVYDDITDTANETPSPTASVTTSSIAPLTLPEYIVEVVP